MASSRNLHLFLFSYCAIVYWRVEHQTTSEHWRHFSSAKTMATSATRPLTANRTGSCCSTAFCVAVVASPVSDGLKTDFGRVTVHDAKIKRDANQRCFERRGSHELNTGRESEREPRVR